MSTRSSIRSLTTSIDHPLLIEALETFQPLPSRITTANVRNVIRDMLEWPNGEERVRDMMAQWRRFVAASRQGPEHPVHLPFEPRVRARYQFDVGLAGLDEFANRQFAPQIAHPRQRLDAGRQQQALPAAPAPAAAQAQDLPHKPSFTSAFLNIFHPSVLISFISTIGIMTIAVSAVLVSISITIIAIIISDLYKEVAQDVKDFILDLRSSRMGRGLELAAQARGVVEVLGLGQYVMTGMATVAGTVLEWIGY